jgi:hypothetical protein
MKYVGSNLTFNYSSWQISWHCKNILMWTTNQVVENLYFILDFWKQNLEVD